MFSLADSNFKVTRAKWVKRGSGVQVSQANWWIIKYEDIDCEYHSLNSTSYILYLIN